MAADKSVLAEALTALLGVTVKLESETSASDRAVKLDVTNLPTTALLGIGALELLLNPESYFRWLKGLFIGVQSQTSSSIKVLYVIPEEFFDPAYDFDFTHMSESDSDSDCKRGNESYKRPYGWMRFALKVRDKYPDGNDWLGTSGWRNRSDPGEWPVSYHGTDLKGAAGIIKNLYQVGPRTKYGRGIYSSPDIDVANLYAKDKKFTSINGKTFKVIMQNRINPNKRKIIEEVDDYWLVPIPEGTSTKKEQEIVQRSIRPYGLLLQEV